MSEMPARGYRDTREHPTREVRNLIDQLVGAAHRLVLDEDERAEMLDAIETLRLRSWDTGYRQGMDDMDEMHRERAALANPNPPIPVSGHVTSTGDLLDDLTALDQAVNDGAGLSLDNDHAQAVLDVIAEVKTLRARPTPPANGVWTGSSGSQGFE